MIAYSSTSLDNLAVQRESYDAFNDNCITKDEWEAIAKKYPAGFYTPNGVLRVGLFALSVIILAFTFGLFTLIFMSGVNSEGTFGGLCIFFGFVTYGALELIVKKRHYCSGVDDAALFMTAVFIVGGFIAIANDPSLLQIAFVTFLVATFLTLRFADSFMSAVSCISLFTTVFLVYIKLGEIAKATAPFVMMIIVAVVYLIAAKIARSYRWRHYRTCIAVIRILSLLCLYAAGNYFAVRELSNQLFHLNLQPGQGIPFAWIFWIFTVIVPVAYIARGIQQKDALILRTGLLLIAATVCTIRYYHALMPIELAMTIGGIAMIIIAYAVIKYLHPSKHGFTYQPIAKNNFTALQVESLIIVETFGQQQTISGNTEFGGGSGGGGGASGEF